MAKGPQAEYTNLVGYFKHLVWLAGGFMTFTVTVAAALVALAGFLFYTNLREARSDAQDAAKRVAVQAAQESIEKAFDEKNVNDLIQKVAQQKIAAITDKMIEQQLTSKLQPIQKRILAIGEISEIEIRIRRGARSALVELTALMAKSSDPDTSQFARSTLQVIVQDYESSAEQELKNNNLSAFDILKTYLPRPPVAKKPPANLADVVGLINEDQDLNVVATAFLAFRELTGEKVKMFDFGAMKRWCASNEPKCK